MIRLLEKHQLGIEHSLSGSKYYVIISMLQIGLPDLPVYCNPPALGRDLAHIITCPISDIYAWSLMSATGYTLSEFTPGYPCPVQSAPYDFLSRPVILSRLHIHCQSGHSARTPS